MDRMFLNVLLLGLGFMLMFTAFQTMGNVQKVVIDSIPLDDPSYKGDGYTSLSLIYAVFALFNWFAPSIVSVTGPRGAMVIGGLTYCGFIVCFLFEKTWLLYFTSAILGIGAAITWTGQGNFLSRCSTSTTISRNSGIFWAMLQASLFFGNLFVYFQFQGKTHIDKDTRRMLFIVLTVVGLLGTGCLAMLRRVSEVKDINESNSNLNEKNILVEKKLSVVGEFKNAARLFVTRDMLLLSVAFFYTGLELSFFSGVYSPSVGFTNKFGSSAKQLVGLSGICIGLGEVFGGVLFGLLGSKTSNRLGRDPIVIGGFIIHIIAFFLIFINLPNLAPFGDTDDVSILETPQAWVALICAGLLGFGDACFNTQIYSMLGGVFAKNSSAAFALFKFTQSVAAACSFAYSSHLGLRAQIYILVIFAIIGTLCFCLVEWAFKRRNNLAMIPQHDTTDTEKGD